LQNPYAFQEIRRIWKILALLQKITWIWKILALLQKSGGFGKYWRFYKNQADLKILTLSRKTGGFTKCWRHAENRRTIESWRALKSLRLKKNQRDWKILAARLLFRLGGISSC
jgi:hypothetical protein